MIQQLELPFTIIDDDLERVCRRWHIRELAVFGSVLRDDFRSDSDIDVLITFDKGVHIGFRELASVEDDLAQLFGRTVDVSTRKAVEQSKNWLLRKAILDHAKVVYATQ